MKEGSFAVRCKPTIHAVLETKDELDKLELIRSRLERLEREQGSHLHAPFTDDVLDCLIAFRSSQKADFSLIELESLRQAVAAVKWHFDALRKEPTCSHLLIEHYDVIVADMKSIQETLEVWIVAMRKVEVVKQIEVLV